jgi:excisionase family DNA binding protein
MGKVDVDSGESEELITVEETAKRLNVTPNAIYKMISQKKLEGIAKHFYGRTNIDWKKLRRQMDAGKFAGKRGGGVGK